MTKANVISKISQKTGIEKATVLEVVENFMEVVKSSMAKGENVYLRGFGSFIIKKEKQKKLAIFLKRLLLLFLLIMFLHLSLQKHL